MNKTPKVRDMGRERTGKPGDNELDGNTETYKKRKQGHTLGERDKGNTVTRGKERRDREEH